VIEWPRTVIAPGGEVAVCLLLLRDGGRYGAGGALGDILGDRGRRTAGK